MRTIPLTQGLVALVDDEDFEMLSARKWRAVNGYARADKPRAEGKKRALLMHRLLMLPAPGQEVDHKNGDGLDCQRDNLRLCTHTQNQQNRTAQANNASGYKGVHWVKARGKWQAAIAENGHRYYLGYFTSKVAAARVYDEAARELHGAFAWTNFPNEAAS